MLATLLCSTVNNNATICRVWQLFAQKKAAYRGPVISFSWGLMHYIFT